MNAHIKTATGADSLSVQFGKVKGHKQTSITPCTTTWGELTQVGQWTHKERDDKDGEGFIFASFTKPNRAASNIDKYHGVVLDVDATERDLPPTPEVVMRRLKELGLAAVIYTSHNHMAAPDINKGKPCGARYRVVVPLTEPIDPARLEAATKHLASLVNLTIDAASYSKGQFFYLPSCRPNAISYSTVVAGNPLDVNSIPAPSITEPKNTAKPKQQAGGAGEYTDSELHDIVMSIKDVSIYERWLRVGMGIHHATSGALSGLDLWAEWSAQCDTYDRNEAASKWASFGDYDGAQITAATLLQLAKADVHIKKWSEPLPLREPESAPPAYPVQAFPKLAKDAIEAIAYHVQAPIGLAGQCVLGTLGYIAQIHVNAPSLHSPLGMPCTLFILTEGASGDRKSGCHNLADKEIKEREQIRFKQYLIEVTDYNKGLSACSNQTQKKEYVENTPQPSNPKSIFSDSTIEPIQGAFIRLAIRNGAWASDEGGQFFSGSTTKGETSNSALGALTRVFDSGIIERDRAKSNLEASGTAYEVRLMVNLLGQREVLNGALTDPILRGQGFLPRFIFAAPQSLAGTRINTKERLKEKSYNDPRLQMFWEHCGKLLPDPNDPISMDEFREIDSKPRPVLELNDEAETTWMNFTNEVEIPQLAGSEYELIRPFAGRAGELARRVATVFAYFEGKTEIDHNAMQSACELVQYSLNEWLRYADVSMTDKKTNQAHQLSTWLIKTCTAKGVRELERRFVMANVTPKAIRQKDTFKDALSLLVEHSHVMHDDRMIMLNPALFT